MYTGGHMVYSIVKPYNIDLNQASYYYLDKLFIRAYETSSTSMQPSGRIDKEPEILFEGPGHGVPVSQLISLIIWRKTTW
jgi:hypothetical protein